MKDTSKPVENVVAVIKLLEARRGSGKRKRFTMYKSHQYSMLGNLSRIKIGDGDRIMMNNEKRPWDDSEDDEDTEMSRVSQTPSTSIFD